MTHGMMHLLRRPARGAVVAGKFIERGFRGREKAGCIPPSTFIINTSKYKDLGDF